MLRTVLLMSLLPSCQLVVGLDDPEPLILESLTITGGQLSPSFDPEITSYTATVSYGDTVTVRPRSPDPDVTMRIGTQSGVNDSPLMVPVQAGTNVLTIELSTPQGVIKTYRVDVQVPGVRFKAPEMHALAGIATSVVKAADFTGDGTPDLAVCSMAGVEVFNGKTFSAIDVAAAAPCFDFAIADLDKQLGLDIVDVNFGTKAVVAYNTGTGVFDPQEQQFGSGVHLISVAIGNIDTDGNLDLMVGDDENGPPFGGIQRWMLGDGSGGFGAVVDSVNIAANPKTTLLGELDSAAGVDAMVLDGRGAAIGLLHGDNVGGPDAFTNGGATSTFDGDEAMPMRPRSLVVTQLDDNPKPDYALVHEDRDQLRIIRNFVGDNTLADVFMYSLQTDMTPMSVVPSDLDGDGNVDLVVIGHNAGTFQIFYGDGLGDFKSMRYQVTSGTSFNLPIGAAVEDFNGDDLLDVVVVTDNPGGQIIVYFQEAK